MDESGLLPIKRQRTEIPKGKEKMGEAAIGEGAVCGICFSDGSLAVRGRIDSCDHFFCFVCIMEWAKVESRCPMCKQRFRFIRRPEVSGLFISESVLEIPARDQVYHPLGNESSALSDPYAQANCRVCHGSNDDELLLLCDLCDSAFHTYCAGLDYTVPEGDWYCHDCTILREEHAKINEDADVGDQDQGTLVLDQQQHVSFFDIVADERSSNIEQQHFRDRPVSRSSTNPQRNSEGIMLHVEETDSSFSSSQGTDPNLQQRDAGQRAGTSQHSCNMQSRVQALRKNWTALQSGSLSFSSTLDGNGDTVSGAKPRTSRPISVLSQQSKSSTSVNSERLTDSSNSTKVPAIIDSQDINKAWKMMQMAKKQRLPMANSSLNSLRLNNSLNSASAISASKGTVNHSLNLLIPKNEMAADKAVGCSTSGTYKQLTSKIMHDGHKSTGSRQKVPDTDSSIQSLHGNRLAVKTSSDVQLGSFKTNRAFTTEFAANVEQVSPVRLSSKFHETTRSSLSSVTCEAARKSLGLCCNSELPLDGNGGHTSRCSLKGYEISDNRSKFEIQSMVKLNLKRLTNGERLGTKKFKEIARASTHSILAACGLEHSKSCARHFSRQVCKHTSQLQQIDGSTRTPGSCRECFHSFVKNVVTSILLEKSTSSSR